MPVLPALDGLRPAGRRVLLRLDLNVPMSQGRVAGPERLQRALPSVRELAAAGARTIILSHLGRPGGRPADDLSLAPVGRALSEQLGQRVVFAGDCTGPASRQAVSDLDAGGVALLENLRFSPGEEANDPDFARALAAHGDLYVNDAFSVSHRAHASVALLPKLLPAAAGRLMEQEVDMLSGALAHPRRPLAAVVGGAKVSTKLALLGRLSERADLLVVGGAMANTFLAARGTGIGASLHEPDMIETARDIMTGAESAGRSLVLPVDAVVPAPGSEEPVILDSLAAVTPSDRILDIGPATVDAVARRLGECRTLVWNGPMGAFELPGFDAGTTALARAAARLTADGSLFSVAGGGDTAAALGRAGVLDGFSYVSTAGGAFLAWLEGTPLPGLVALEAGA